MLKRLSIVLFASTVSLTSDVVASTASQAAEKSATQENKSVTEEDNKGLATRLGALKTAKRKGQTAPEFELPASSGELIRLSTLLSKGPAIIAFYRGQWCPFCNRELHDLQKHKVEFAKRAATLVAISPQTPTNSELTAVKDKLDFLVLSDLSNKVARDFGLVYKVDRHLNRLYKTFGIDLKKYNGNDSGELPIPATYVVNQKGEIVYAHVNSDIKKRAPAEEIVEVLDRQKMIGGHDGG